MDYSLTKEHWEQAVQMKWTELNKKWCRTQSSTPRQLHKTNTKYSQKAEIIFHYTTNNRERDMITQLFSVEQQKQFEFKCYNVYISRHCPCMHCMTIININC